MKTGVDALKRGDVGGAIRADLYGSWHGYQTSFYGGRTLLEGYGLAASGAALTARYGGLALAAEAGVVGAEAEKIRESGVLNQEAEAIESQGLNRPFLTSDELQSLDPRTLATWQTADEQIARSAIIQATGQTNPAHSSTVSLFSGFYAQSYGRFHVIWETASLDLGPAYDALQLQTTDAVIKADAIGYTTTEELIAAGILK